MPEHSQRSSRSRNSLSWLSNAAAWPIRDVEIGSYPRWTDATWRTKITFDAQDESRIEAARRAFVASLPDDIPSTLVDPDDA